MAVSLLISDVDAGTDTIEIEDHGLVTGDGPAVVYAPDGTIPGGLTPLADVWAIRVDDDHLQLAASSADAVAGTEINLTDAGSGPLYLQLGVPYRRAHTHVAGVSRVYSADLNDTQDALKALWALLTGQAQSLWEVRPAPWPHTADEHPLAAAAFSVEAGGTASLIDGQWTFGAVSLITAPIRIPAGRRIANVTLTYNRGGAGNVTMTLCKRVGGTKTTIATKAFSSGTGMTSGTFDVAPDYTIAAGEALYLRVQCDNAANVVESAIVGFDFPAP
jgi:hypothetical protein